MRHKKKKMEQHIHKNIYLHLSKYIKKHISIKLYTWYVESKLILNTYYHKHREKCYSDCFPGKPIFQASK